MKIHTLGPAVTDSYRAAEQYRADHENLEVVGHPSFEVLYQSIPELRGELLLISRGGQNANRGQLGGPALPIR
ncbi:hypothetical protein ACW19A_02455 [Limosilactobacillus fermentum]|uniref:hypothetical protein n=1 Tax=Limosilactobacillus fermentum TaxID=1613 RepID=UPI00280B1A25|nr:hypothetical protein [Limosilactobacillus fermentum]WNY95960.1 hypothetical protein OS909_05665 [Limosilactobacillus fermentum]